MLVDTGEARRHAMFDYCTFEFWSRRCQRVEHIKLADVGILGNGHLHYLKKSSDQIAGVIEKWIQKALGKADE
jgi:hypothetical protein